MLLRRTKRRNDRPLAEKIKDLLPLREPLYAEADIVVQSRDEPHDTIVDEIVAAMRRHLGIASAESRAMTAQPRASEPIVVPVALGARAYDIVIGRGLLASLGARIKALRPGARVRDRHRRRRWPSIISAPPKPRSQAAGIEASRIVVPPGEGSKSYATFETVCEAIIAARIERGDLVVALGGGVIGDLAGFAAASVRRGIDFVQVPTTLLAQVDSSVGGKTGINSRARQEPGRRLPSADPGDRRHRAARHAAAARVPRRLCRGRQIRAARRRRLLRLAGDELAGRVLRRQLGSFAREHAIAVCCRGKAGIVARDERETGERALLNLGHTFGHALEAAAGFSDRLLHGEAVALGMALAFDFSARRGLIRRQPTRRARARTLRRSACPPISRTCAAACRRLDG